MAREMIKVHGSGTLGMSLGDVRRFVEATKDLNEGEWVDCEIPSQTQGKNQVAALMGLQV